MELPPLNLVLRNICEYYLQQIKEKGDLCSLHLEKLSLFCRDDQKLICEQCINKDHQDHCFYSISKAASPHKETLQTHLKTLEKKLESVKTVRDINDKVAAHKKSQVLQAEEMINQEFEKLHEFLRKEKVTRITALRNEEKDRKNRMSEELDTQIKEISLRIEETKKVLQDEDTLILQPVFGSATRCRQQALGLYWQLHQSDACPCFSLTNERRPRPNTEAEALLFGHVVPPGGLNGCELIVHGTRSHRRQGAESGELGMSLCLKPEDDSEGLSTAVKRVCRRGSCTGEAGPAEGASTQVSVIIPVHNAADWLDQCLQAVVDQDYQGSVELSVYNDSSTDNSRAIIEGWREKLEKRGISLVISGHNSDKPKGVGFAKNQAVCQSSGQYLCFQDADDVMMPQRIRLQYEEAVRNPTAIVGCQVRRDPEGSTERYTRWINSLSTEQLYTQVYTSHGPTVVMPTWFCSRDWFLKVGPFDEGGKGVPEDLLWFYRSLRLAGSVLRVDECLLVYRYHQHAATHSVLEETIWTLRVNFLQERVLSQWDSFTIWNAGKQGRKLYRSLDPTNQKKVKAFCDVDENKIKKGFYTYEESKEHPKPKIPVLHFKDASPPFIVCVKLDMTGGVLEESLASLKLKEGEDFYHFN